jgi:hypothetical protein
LVPADHAGTGGGGASSSSAIAAPAIAVAIDDDRGGIDVPLLFVRRRRGGVRRVEGRSRSDDRDEQQFREEGDISHIQLEC